MKSQSRKVVGLSLVAGALLGLSASAFSIGNAKYSGQYLDGRPVQYQIDRMMPITKVPTYVEHRVVVHHLHPVVYKYRTTTVNPVLYRGETSTSVVKHAPFWDRAVYTTAPAVYTVE